MEIAYNLLKKYSPTDPEEIGFKERMLDFLTKHDDCFLRSCNIGHFTASGFLLNKNMTHICLMHHKKLDKWLQLGGHCDGNPNLLEVAIKETQEESGIQDIKPIKNDIFDIDIHLIPENDLDKAHYHFDIRFLLHAHSNDELVKNHESRSLIWFEINNSNPPKDLLRMFRKCQAFLIHSTIF